MTVRVESHGRQGGRRPLAGQHERTGDVDVRAPDEVFGDGVGAEAGVGEVGVRVDDGDLFGGGEDARFCIPVESDDLAGELGHEVGGAFVGSEDEVARAGTLGGGDGGRVERGECCPVEGELGDEVGAEGDEVGVTSVAAGDDAVEVEIGDGHARLARAAVEEGPDGAEVRVVGGAEEGAAGGEREIGLGIQAVDAPDLGEDARGPVEGEGEDRGRFALDGGVDEVAVGVHGEGGATSRER